MPDEPNTTPETKPTPATDLTAEQMAKTLITPPEDAPTLTQKQADALIGSRVKEAKASSLAALAKELDFASVDDLKAAAKDAKQRQDNEASDLEKATKRAEKAEADAAAKDTALAAANAARIADKVNSKLEALASKAGTPHPEDVVRYLRTNQPDDVAKLVGENEVIDEKTAITLVEGVRKVRENWFTTNRGVGSPSVSGGRPLQPDTELNKAALAQTRRKVRMG